MRILSTLALTLAFLPLTLRAEDAPAPDFTYWAELAHIVDGDHVALDIDLGFGVWVRKQTLALLDAGGAEKTPEERKLDNARIAKLRELLSEATDIVIRTTRDKTTTPPRYLVTIWADGVNVNEALAKAFP